MKLDINKTKKKRKVSDATLENPVKKKKSKNREITETSSTVKNEILETPGDISHQERSQRNENGKEKKKKKRKVEEIDENSTVEKKTKINDVPSSEAIQNGATITCDDTKHAQIDDDSDNDDTEKIKLSNKEANKLTGKLLRKSFNSQEGLEALRKFLSVCEKNKQKDLASEYLQAGGSALEILRLLDTSDKKNLNNASAVFSAMRLIIIKILAEYPQYQSNAKEACRHFINSHLSFVHSMLSSQSCARHRKIVLRLLASMVSLGGDLPRELLGHLSFHSQVLDTLSQQTKPTDSQSVRTCFIHFVLAFLVEGEASVIRAMLDKRGMLSSIFPELTYDSHATVHLVLNTVKTWVLENPAISKTLKLHVFSTPVLQSLVSLYNWKGPNNWPGPKGKKRDTGNNFVNPEEKEIAVEAVHDFLTTLLTSNRHGVIFHDRSLGTSGRRCNQLVNTVLQSLDRPWEHAKPLEIVLKILIACPDLVRSQLSYTEPFLEPRATKKWIMAMRFVGKLMDSLMPENCLKPCLPELAGSQLINAVQSLTMPLGVLKIAISGSLKDVNTIIRNEGMILLTKMLKKARAFGKIIQENCHEADIVAFKHAMLDHISKNVPSLETILKVWNFALDPGAKMELTTCQEEILEFIPSDKSYFTAMLDLLQAYSEICSSRLDLANSPDFSPKILLDGLDELSKSSTDDFRSLKLKALKFLLPLDPAAFSSKKSLFARTLAFLIGLIEKKSSNELQTQTRETIKRLLDDTGIFEACNEQMDIWIESFAILETTEEKIVAADWFVSCVRRTLKKIDESLDMIVEAEESAVEEIFSTEKLEDIFHELNERDDSSSIDTRMTNISAPISISPIICSAFESMRKNSNEIITGYMSRVIVLTFHCQVNPGILVHLMRKVANFPAKKYLTGWLTDEKPMSIKTSFLPSMSSLARLSKILLKNETAEMEKFFQGEKIIEFDYRGEKAILRHDLETYEVVVSLRMTIFYLAQFIRRGKLSKEQFDSYKSCIIALLRIAKDSCNGEMEFVKKCSGMILGNSTIIQYFSPFRDSRSIGEKIVTPGLVDIFQTVIDLNDANVTRSLFLPFRNKFIVQLCSATKKCNNDDRAKEDSSCLLEFMDILRPTCSDIVEALKTIVNLSKMSFIADKSELSIWGNIVPKLIELLTRRKNDRSENFTIDAIVVKKIFSHLIQLKAYRTIRMDTWESSLREYLESCPRNIAGVDGHAFNSLLKLPRTSATTNLLSFLVSRNDQYISLFVKFVSNNTKILAQSDLIFPILASRLNYSWNREFLTKIHAQYKNDILRYFAEPANDENWISRNVKATIFLIESCFESEDCEKACEIVWSNGDKLDSVDIGYVQLLEILFKKSSKLDNNSEDSLTKLIQILIRITVSALKKDSKNENKLETLCKSLDDTINLLKSNNNDFIFEDLNKNYSWPQFTRFSLKMGFKTSKNDEKHNSLLRTLVNVCEIAYKDGSENEYVKTLFEMTTSHSEFANIMLSSQIMKRDLLELLWVLVRKNHSTMSSSQIPLYLAAYNATLDESDQFILLILRHYEDRKIRFNEYRPYLWGEAAATHYSVKGEADTALWRQPSTSQVLDLFDREIVKKTIKHFPVQRKLKPLGLCEAEKVYDPSFYLPLLTYLLSDNNVVACHKVTQGGALALAFAASGSTCPETRAAAYTVISRFYFHLEATSSKEKHLWIRFIDAFRNGIIDMNSSHEAARMSCLVSTFLARASIVTTQPMNPLYSPIQAFLMAKPSLELCTIPELLKLFHSSEIEHLAHRHWILEIVRDGMRTNFDMDIALKCVIFKMLMDFYTSVLSDTITKRLILQIIESTVKISKAGLLLARSYGLLAWLVEISKSLNSRDIERIDLVVTIVRETLDAIMRTNDRDKDCQFLLLNVLMSVKSCLSKNTRIGCFSAYTSSLSEILNVKTFRIALDRQDLEEIVELAEQIYGNVEDIMDALRYGGEFSSKIEYSSANDDESTKGRASLRKLVLIWCGHGSR